MLNKLMLWLIVGVLYAIKLIATGICLAIGFSLGGSIVKQIKIKKEIAKIKEESK